jgi:hypothetical protein
MTLRRIALFVCGSVFLLGLLALQFWVLPTKFVGWVALLTLGLPTWLLLEWLGEKVSSSQFFRKMSSPARIAIGVPVFGALCVVAALLAGVVRHLAGLS